MGLFYRLTPLLCMSLCLSLSWTLLVHRGSSNHELVSPLRCLVNLFSNISVFLRVNVPRVYNSVYPPVILLRTTPQFLFYMYSLPSGTSLKRDIDPGTVTLLSSSPCSRTVFNTSEKKNETTGFLIISYLPEFNSL